MDPTRGIVQLIAELGESAVQRGLQVAAGLSAGMEGLDPTDLTSKVAGAADLGRANTDLVVSLVRSEVDKAVGRMGFVREEELAAVRRHVERLEAALAEAGITAKPPATPGTAGERPAKPTKPTKKPTKKPAKKATTKATKKPVKKTAAEAAPGADTLAADA